MAYETIEIEKKDAGTVHILTGVVTDVGSGVVDVNIDDHGAVSDVPVFYHCPDCETADGNPFSTDDRVIIVNSGSAVNPVIANMKVIGFEDGLPRECCFSGPFTEEDFTWVASKATTGDGLLSQITGPTGPLDFAAAFDKPPGAPHPATFKGGGIAQYRIENLDLPSCKYFIFKLDAVNIIKDLDGWSKSCSGSIAIEVGGVSKEIAIYTGALPGLYYSEFFYYEGQERKITDVYISGGFYTECYDISTIHHEVNMTFDYIKMSNEIPEGATQVWSQIPV